MFVVCSIIQDNYFITQFYLHDYIQKDRRKNNILINFNKYHCTNMRHISIQCIIIQLHTMALWHTFRYIYNKLWIKTYVLE